MITVTSWLVVVSERCLHVSVTKFWHKFVTLRQVNTPSRWDKFQNCCTDMYLTRCLPNFAVICVFLWISRDFADLPEFRGSATARNIRSPECNRRRSSLFFQGPTYSMIRNKFYYKVKTLIPNITQLPINGLINELMNSSNYLIKIYFSLFWCSRQIIIKVT